MKKDHKSIIKDFLKKQKEKISIPFLKKDGMPANFIQKTIEILPKLIKKDKNEETSENLLVNLPKTENKTKIIPKVVLSKSPSTEGLIQKGQLKENILQSFAVLSKPLVKQDNEFKVLPNTAAKQDKTTKKNTICAKLSDSSVIVGGGEGAKLMPLRTYGPNKTLSLVGEAGKEKVDVSTGSVIPLEKPKFSYSQLKPKTSKVNIVSKDALGTISSVVLPKYDTKQVLRMLETKQIDNPIKTENNELSIEVPAHFLGALGSIAKSMAGGVAKASASIGKAAKSATTAAKGALKAAGKNALSMGKQAIKGAFDSDNKNNKASAMMSSISNSSGVPVSPTAGIPEPGQLQQNDEMAQLEKAKQSSSAFLETRQMSSSSLQSTGDKELDTEGGKPQEPSSESGGIGAAVGGIASGIGSAIGGIASGIGQGLGSVGGIMAGGGLLGMGIRALAGSKKDEGSGSPIVNTISSGAPVSVTNVSYQYDVYRKTADDSFMLPNFRREYG